MKNLKKSWKKLKYLGVGVIIGILIDVIGLIISFFSSLLGLSSLKLISDIIYTPAASIIKFMFPSMVTPYGLEYDLWFLFISTFLLTFLLYTLLATFIVFIFDIIIKKWKKKK